MELGEVLGLLWLVLLVRIVGSLRKGQGPTHAQDVVSVTFRPSGCGLREVAVAQSTEWKDKEAEDAGASISAYQLANFIKSQNLSASQLLHPQNGNNNHKICST